MVTAAGFKSRTNNVPFVFVCGNFHYHNLRSRLYVGNAALSLFHLFSFAGILIIINYIPVFMLVMPLSLCSICFCLREIELLKIFRRPWSRDKLDLGSTKVISVRIQTPTFNAVYLHHHLQWGSEIWTCLDFE